MTWRADRRADLLVGVGDEGERAEAAATCPHPRAIARSARERVEAGQQAGLHVVHAGAVGTAVGDAKRTGRGRAGSKTVSMCPISSAAAAARAAVELPTTVSPRRPAGSGRRSTRAPRSARAAAVQAADLVDAGLGVRCRSRCSRAVRQVGEEAGQACASTASAKASSSESVTGRRRWAGSSAGSLRQVRRPILRRPCAWSRSGCSTARTSTASEPTVKIEVAVGRRRTWYGQRLPGPHAVVELGRPVRARDVPKPVRDLAAWVRRLHRLTDADAWLADEGRAAVGGAAAASPFTAPASRAHWIVAFPWREHERALEIAEAAVRCCDRGPGTDHAGPSQPTVDARRRPHPSGR